ncbi:hypothetical protein CHS0354_001483, partial [Potamilus streckersoni]
KKKLSKLLTTSMENAGLQRMKKLESLKNAERKLQRARMQIDLLNGRLLDLNATYSRAKIQNRRFLCHILTLRIQSVTYLRNVYSSYAKDKATIAIPHGEQCRTPDTEDDED